MAVLQKSRSVEYLMEKYHWLSYVQTDTSTPNIVGQTMLGVVASTSPNSRDTAQRQPLLGR